MPSIWDILSPGYAGIDAYGSAQAKRNAIDLGPAGANADFSTQLYARKQPKQKLQYMSDLLGIQGQSDISKGESLLGQPLSYWQNLLQPPTRQSLLERQGPAVSSVVGQYSTGKKALTEGPRGGGTSAVAAELPFQEAGATTGLIEGELQTYIDTLQPEAANAITGIATSLSNLGLSELGLQSQDLQALIGAALSKSGQNMAAAGDAGKGIGAIIAALIQAGAAGA